MSNTVLELIDVTKRYASFTLDHVSFHADEGRIIGFIGRNGAGKTTTMKAIYGLIEIDEGSIILDGKSVKKDEQDIKNDIGLLFGGIDYYPNQKVKTLTSVTKSFYSNWDEALYRKWLKYFELDEEKRIKELSNGMKVKYGLAVALSHGAKLLILDEPTSGLDPVSRDEVLDCFMKIAKMKGTTIIFSTHVISDLEKCADDIVYIQKGKIVKAATAEEFKSGYLKVEGEVNSLTSSLKDKIGHYREHGNKFAGTIPAEYKNDFASYDVTEASLEDIMLFIERGVEDEESPF
ncbi:MAG: ABC transporter ATP-binding protein [Bacilli bacterium]|nr:ABC transporter ATP-binding protein [Bacilli bacterium]